MSDPQLAEAIEQYAKERYGVEADGDLIFKSAINTLERKDIVETGETPTTDADEPSGE